MRNPLRRATVTAVCVLTLLAAGGAASASGTTPTPAQETGPRPALSGTRDNGCGNPILETGLTGWGTTGSDVGRHVVTTDHIVAGHELEVTPAGTRSLVRAPSRAVPGEGLWDLTIDVRSAVAAHARVEVIWFDADDEAIGRAVGRWIPVVEGTRYTRIGDRFLAPGTAVLGQVALAVDEGAGPPAAFAATLCSYHPVETPPVPVTVGGADRSPNGEDATGEDTANGGTGGGTTTATTPPTPTSPASTSPTTTSPATTAPTTSPTTAPTSTVPSTPPATTAPTTAPTTSPPATTAGPTSRPPATSTPPTSSTRPLTPITTTRPTTTPPTTSPRPTTTPPTTPGRPGPTDPGRPGIPATPLTAAERYGWGTPLAASDEFNYTGAPDASKWRQAGECWPGHNRNGQRCASRSTVANGKLVMTGLANGDTGWLASAYGTRYGRWEARVRTFATGSSGQPYHPVLIVWPDSERWPEDGEYDFLENDQPGADCAEAFLHYPHPTLPVQQEFAQETDCGTPLSEWHTIAFEWTPEHVRGFVDGEPFFSFSGGAGPGGRQAIQAMPSGHLTIQLDNFVGSRGLAPATMEVDWVRIYGV